MTKLTALELYVIIDTLLHSLQFGKSWTGSLSFGDYHVCTAYFSAPNVISLTAKRIKS